jgi:hypothetical protein
MAMAAAGAGEAAAPVVQLGVDTYRDFSKSPAKWMADHLLKWGLVTVIAGGISYVISVAAARQEQAFLNDIQARLGLPQTVSPTPPKVPPTPPSPTLAQATISFVVGSVYNFDLTNAQITGQKCIDSVNSLAALQSPLQDQYANTEASQNAGLAVIGFYKAATALGWVPPGTPLTAFPTNPNAPLPTPGATTTTWIYAPGVLFTAADGVAVDWDSAVGAEVRVWQAMNAVNQMAALLNMPQPFVTGQIPGQPAPPVPASTNGGAFGWLSGIFAAAGADLSTLGADATQAVNDVAGFFGTVASDVQKFAGDVGGAIAYASRVVLNFPILMWDALGYGVTWGTHTVFGDMAPWLVVIGAVMIAVGVAMTYLYPRIMPRLELLANARGARFWNRFDKRLGIRSGIQAIWTQKSTEASMHSANANPVFVPPEQELPPTPVPEPPPAATPAPIQEAPKVPEPVPVAPEGPSPNSAPETPIPTPEAPVKAPDAANAADSPPPPPEPPVPATEAEKEELLGDGPSLREQKMALAAKKPPEARREPTADELLELAGSFPSMNKPPPTFEEEVKLVNDAREVGYKEGAQTYLRGTETRSGKLTAKIVKVETGDGEKDVEVAQQMREAREKGFDEGQKSKLRGGKGPRKAGYRTRRKMQPGEEY